MQFVCVFFCRFGIRVNAILPGFIETPMTQAVPDQIVEKMKKHIPLGHMGSPESMTLKMIKMFNNCILCTFYFYASTEFSSYNVGHAKLLRGPWNRHSFFSKKKIK